MSSVPYSAISLSAGVLLTAAAGVYQALKAGRKSRSDETTQEKADTRAELDRIGRDRTAWIAQLESDRDQWRERAMEAEAMLRSPAPRRPARRKVSDD